MVQTKNEKTNETKKTGDQEIKMRLNKLCNGENGKLLGVYFMSSISHLLQHRGGS